MDFEPFADVGDGVIDEGGLGAMCAAFRAIVDPYRGHSERLGRAKISGHVLDHQRMRRIDSEALAQQGIAVRIGLGLQFAGVNVVKSVEMAVDPDRGEHAARIRFVGIGEEEFAAGQPGEA